MCSLHSCYVYGMIDWLIDPIYIMIESLFKHFECYLHHEHVLADEWLYIDRFLFCNNIAISAQKNTQLYSHRIIHKPPWLLWFMVHVNTLSPRQNGRHFPDDIFRCIFLNENVWISIEVSLKFFPKGPINNLPALVQIMAWRRSGDKPLSEPMMVNLLTHICVTRPQCVKVHHMFMSD